MLVKSKKSIHFPKLNFGIRAGEIVKLPKDREAQKVILSHPAITEVKEEGVNSKK